MKHYVILLTVAGLFLLMTATEASADCGKCEAGGEQLKEGGGGKGKCEGDGKKWKEGSGGKGKCEGRGKKWKGGGKKGKKGRGGCGCTFGPKMLSKFNLSAEQQAEVDALRDKMHKDNKPVDDKLDTLRAEMQKLWLADKPSEESILKQQAKMTPLREKLRNRRVRFKIDVLSLLSPEQKLLFKEHVKSKKGKEGKGKGKRGRCLRD
ncbi:MAG: Spy/CpxP family protein refolding chaperone [Proteobacteria bacterium]|nr:Spy/CpxP family protein refolding chaperone [Pseudomonadota bacterium]